MNTYTAVCTREGDWWEIRVPKLGDRATQALRLEQVPDMVRSLVSLIEEIPTDQVIVDMRPARFPRRPPTRWPPGVPSRTPRLAAEHATAAAVRALIEDGFAVRDVGAMLGLSPQRVSQIARTHPARAAGWQHLRRMAGPTPGP